MQGEQDAARDGGRMLVSPGERFPSGLRTRAGSSAHSGAEPMSRPVLICLTLIALVSVAAVVVGDGLLQERLARAARSEAEAESFRTLAQSQSAEELRKAADWDCARVRN